MLSLHGIDSAKAIFLNAKRKNEQMHHSFNFVSLGLVNLFVWTETEEESENEEKSLQLGLWYSCCREPESNVPAIHHQSPWADRATYTCIFIMINEGKEFKAELTANSTQMSSSFEW